MAGDGHRSQQDKVIAQHHTQVPLMEGSHGPGEGQAAIPSGRSVTESALSRCVATENVRLYTQRNRTSRSACPVRGKGGRSKSPTTSPHHCAPGHSRENWPIRREQGPGRGHGRAMPHKECLAVTGPQDEPSRGGGRGSPNTRSTREGDLNEITVFPRSQPYRAVFSRESSIPESRATGATTSLITRDCNPPIDEGRGCPTVQSVKQGREPRCRKWGWRGNRDAPRQWHSTTKAIRKESEGRRGGCTHHSSRELGHHKRGEANLS